VGWWLSPNAVIVEVGVGVYGLDDIAGCDFNFGGLFDDVSEGVAEVAVAQIEEFEDVGEAVGPAFDFSSNFLMLLRDCSTAGRNPR